MRFEVIFFYIFTPNVFFFQKRKKVFSSSEKDELQAEFNVSPNPNEEKYQELYFINFIFISMKF
jgi:hypothetical protein